MINFLQLFLALLIIAYPINQSYGQSDIDTIILNKGEVIDILLLSQNPDTENELKSYFQSVVPVGKQMSYQSLPGFKVSDYTQGNILPTYLILGKWNSVKKREEFLAQILDKVPDFHERRRKIWSYFGLRYFEIKENLSVIIRRDHYHVATAYWMESEDQSSKFYNKWKQEIQKSGGEILIQLKDGKSPFGYQYDPEYFVISSWKSKADFSKFQKRIEKLKWDNIAHVNEFIL